MKRLLRVAMLVCLVTIFLSAWPLPTVSASVVIPAKGQAGQGHLSLNADGNVPFAPSPNLRGGGEFSAVAAVSGNDIWAVGDGIGTLIEHWNGTQWSLVKSPSPGTAFNNLTDVVAVSANDVWAVGGADSLALIEHWNGTQWSVVSSPSPNNDAILNGVAAASASNVWAVGNVNNFAQTLIEQWNGSSWSIVPSPNPGSSSNSLIAVAVVSVNDVWAVGGEESGTSGERTLIEQWNGTQWNVVPSPSPGSFINDLLGLTALSASNVWAVGYHDGNSTIQTLIEHWNGRTWSVIKSPNVGIPRVSRNWSLLSMTSGF